MIEIAGIEPRVAALADASLCSTTKSGKNKLPLSLFLQDAGVSR